MQITFSNLRWSPWASLQTLGHFYLKPGKQFLVDLALPLNIHIFSYCIRALLKPQQTSSIAQALKVLSAKLRLKVRPRVRVGVGLGVRVRVRVRDRVWV